MSFVYIFPLHAHLYTVFSYNIIKFAMLYKHGQTKYFALNLKPRIVFTCVCYE